MIKLPALRLLFRRKFSVRVLSWIDFSRASPPRCWQGAVRVLSNRMVLALLELGHVGSERMTSPLRRECLQLPFLVDGIPTALRCLQCPIIAHIRPPRCFY